ncbi:ribosomal protein S6 kinase 2 beta-like [Paramacrobiotus metropolitanus]|uniref:ribosomal protein S6 kinase 2 beta-like n=1 Tax=Paramacrobiotus metropolitanus TaxID=2943436 RepID=UPI002445A309|nr:ribosomal protein S6 kinase 2 beta-like [Paramacrobiotus metropolitanus]
MESPTSAPIYRINGTEYHLQTIIGMGAFGKVYVAEQKTISDPVSSSENLVAIKVLSFKVDEPSGGADLVSGTEQLREKLSKKWNTIFPLRHVNVVRYIDGDLLETGILQKLDAVIVLEYCELGTLGRYVASMETQVPPTYLSAAAVKYCASDILNGLSFLHAARIIHTDIKPDNILLSRAVSHRITAKISDIDDHVRIYGSVTKTKDMTHFQGTVQFMSPEMLNQRDLNELKDIGRKTDIWSFGCVMIRLVKHDQPFVLANADGQRCVVTPKLVEVKIRDFIVLKKCTPHIPEGTSADLSNMLSQCLQRNPKDRPGAAALLNDPYFQSDAEILDHAYRELGDPWFYPYFLSSICKGQTMEELRGSPSPGSRFESSKAQDTPQLTGQTESGIVPGRPRTEIPLLTMIGQGSGGEVYRTCVDQQDVAIKVISSTKTDNLEQIRTEVMETSSKHKFEYVQLYSHAEIAQAVTGEQQLSIRMPFSAGGTLREFIRKYKNEIPLHYQYEYTYQLLLAVENLHVDRRRIHGDIKSENIMVHDLFGEAVRLIDCEGAVPISKGFHYQTGTLHTMSPEMILFDQDDEGVGKVTEKTDIWSAGCVLLEMVLGEYPVYEPECGDFQITHEDKNLAIWYDYFAGRYGTPLPPKIPTDIPLILYSVIDQCLQINPDDRADILQLTGLFESYKNEVTTSSLKCAVMPALGRNLQLGMLYDPFTDTAYPLEDDRINVLENSF